MGIVPVQPLTTNYDSYWRKKINKYAAISTNIKLLAAKNPLKFFHQLAYITDLFSEKKTRHDSDTLRKIFLRLHFAKIKNRINEQLPGVEQLQHSVSLAIKCKNVYTLSLMVHNGFPINSQHVEFAIQHHAEGITSRVFSQNKDRILQSYRNDPEQINHYLCIACKSNNEPVADYLFKLGGNAFGWYVKINNIKTIRSPIDLAYSHGHKELCKKLLLNYHFRSDNVIHKKIIQRLKTRAETNNDADMHRFLSTYVSDKPGEQSKPNLALTAKFKNALYLQQRPYLNYLISKVTELKDLVDLLIIALEARDLDSALKLFDVFVKNHPKEPHNQSSFFGFSVIPMALKNQMNPFMMEYFEKFPGMITLTLPAACKAGNLEIAQFCLENGAKIEGALLLQNSIESGSVKTVQWALNFIPKSEINQLFKSKAIYHALNGAIRQNNVEGNEILLLLADLGLDLFRILDVAYSHFHNAVVAGWKDVVDFGLAELARRSEKTYILQAHSKVIVYERAQKNDAMLASLIRTGFNLGSFHSIVTDCANLGLIETLRALIEKHAGEKNAFNFSLLKQAIMGQHDEVASLLIQTFCSDRSSTALKVLYWNYNLSIENGLVKTTESILRLLREAYLIGTIENNDGSGIYYPSVFLEETLLGETINPHKVVFNGTKTETFYVNMDFLREYPTLVELLSQGELTHKDVDPIYFKQLLAFLLNKEPVDSHASVKELIKLSNTFELVELQLSIEKWIQPRLECNTWLKKLTLIIDQI